MLLLAALSPFAAPPAHAQVTVWSATLTVDWGRDGVVRGCSILDTGNTQDDCSTALTDDDFTFNGFTYRIWGLNQLKSADGIVTLTLDKAVPSAALTLHLGTRRLSTNDAERQNARGVGNRWAWQNTGHPRWTDGQQVSVKLTWPATPTEPRNLRVTPGDAKLELSWRAPTETVTGYDVHYTSSTTVADGAQAGTDAAMAWVAVDRSSAGTRASQSIPSLVNYRAYRVRVRAENSGGSGVWAFGRGTPTDKSNDATLSGLTALSLTATDGTFTPLFLVPSFAANTTSYAAQVTNARSHVKLTPTVNDAAATVQVGRTGSLTAVTSGQASEAVALKLGANVIEVRVTAEDGTTVRTYTVTVTRELPPLSPLPPPSTLTLTTSAHDNRATESAGAVRVTATLDRPAGAGGVMVALAAGGASTATATEDFSLPAAFTIADGRTAASGQMRIVDDQVDEDDETVVLATAVSGLTVTEVTLTIGDNDTASVRMSESALTVMAPETGSYRVWLATKPTEDVTVTPTSGTPERATVSGAVTFTPNNWQTAREVTVMGVAAGAATVSHAVMSADAKYGGLTVGTVAVTVVGRDVPRAAAPTFNPANGSRTTNAGTNITLSFGEAIRKDASNTDFSGHADLASILTLKTNSSSGAAIGYVASINSARTVITIDPTSDLPGGAVYVAISDGYYDENGTQGTAARATFTVESPGRTPADLVPTFGAATVADRSYTAGTAIAALVLPEATGGDGTLRYRLTPAPPAGLTLDAATRTLSGTPDTPQGAVRYTWTATDADGDEATLSFTIVVASGAPTALTLSAAPAPEEGGGEVTVTARLDASAPVGGTTVRLSLSGTAAGTGEDADYTLSSASIAIAAGATEGTATIVVIDDAVDDDAETIVIDAASDTPALTAETLTLTIADNDEPATPSSDASLRGLLISDGALAFDPARTSYAVAVAHEVASVKLTPTVNHAGATVAVNGAAVESGMPSGSIALRVGENRVAVVVTAADGTTRRTYRVTVTRGVKILGAAEKAHVDKVGQALLGRNDPGVPMP